MGEKKKSRRCLLEDIWKDQKRYNSNFIDYENLTEKEQAERAKQYTLLMVDELMEMLRETNWKTHRKSNKKVIESNLKEELIDIFKYWLSLMLLWDFDLDDLVEEYYRKSAVVEQRHQQEKALHFKPGKIAGVDIDGVLAEYPQGFLDFVNKKLGTNLSADNLVQYNLYEAFDIPVETMEELKHEFRSTGQKRFLPVLPGAKELLQTLKEEGYQVVLLSARPYKKYKRIFADTQEWLKKNGLSYDAIMWGDDKCLKLLREFGKDSVNFFIEDHLKQANDVARLGCKVYLIDKTYNKGKTAQEVERVKDLFEICRKVKGGENNA